MSAHGSDHIRGDAELQCRNVMIAGQRTSIRMEGVFWQVLATICQRESVTIEDLLTRIEELRGPANRTAAIRVLVTVYARMACTADEEDSSTDAGRPRRRILDDVLERILMGRRPASGAEAGKAVTGGTAG